MMKSIFQKHLKIWYRPVLCAAFLGVLFFTRFETARIAPLAAAMVVAICLGMMVLRRLCCLTLPLLLLSLALIFCYDSFDVFIRYIWLAPIPVVALVWHILRLRPKWYLGKTALPLLSVALATLLGGVGTISGADYFAPMSLYYVLGLSVGLVFSYWLLKNEIRGQADREALLFDLAAFALTAAAVMYLYPLTQWKTILELKTLPGVQWSNNLATMLLLSFPAVFGLAKKRLSWLWAAALAVGATMLTCSRGGILFAPVLAMICMLWLWRSTPKEDFLRRSWYSCVFWQTVCLMGAVCAVAWMQWYNYGFTQEARLELLFRCLKDWRANPIFGRGLAYRGNSDLYDPRTGAMNWYHMLIPQIVGSLGTCGILAWGWQLYARGKLMWEQRRDRNFSFGLCYVGLLLMSFVNPGEFCPVPYAFCAVLFFAAMESDGEPKASC